MVAAAALASALLSGAGVVLWYRLPSWAPEWVERHSPLVGPLLRAEAVIRQRALFPVGDLHARVRELGQRAGPGLHVALSDGALEIRLLALEGLQEVPYAPAAARLVALLADHRLEEAEPAGVALLSLEDSRCTDVVLGGLERVDVDGQELLLTWLSRHGDRRCLVPVAIVYWQKVHDGIEPAFDYPGLLRRLCATAEAVAIQGDFRPLLKAAEPAWKMAAMHALGELEAADAAPDLVAGLVDGDEKVRRTAAAALEWLDLQRPGVTAAQMPALLKLLEPQPGPTRKQVVSMLAGTCDARAVQAVVGLLRAHVWDQDTRDQALDGLEINDDPTITAAMVEVLTGRWPVDGDSQRARAAEVLGAAHAPAILAVLDTACADSSSTVRDCALAARARSPDARVDGELVEALADPVEMVRWRAITTIIDLRRPTGMDALLALLEAQEQGPVPLFLSTAQNQPWWVATNVLRSSTYPFSDGQRCVLAAALARYSAALSALRDAYNREREPNDVPCLVLR